LNLSSDKKQADEKQTPALGDTNNKITITKNNQQTVAKVEVEIRREEKIEVPREKDKPEIIAKAEVEIRQEEKTEVLKEQDKAETKTVVVFEYPVSLPKKLKHQLEQLLKKISDPEQAQDLLNYFAQRLINTTIRNPIAYFITLLERFKKGLLFLSDSDKESPEKNFVHCCHQESKPLTRSFLNIFCSRASRKLCSSAEELSRHQSPSTSIASSTFIRA